MAGRAVWIDCRVPLAAVLERDSRQVCQTPTVGAVCSRKQAPHWYARDDDSRNSRRSRCRNPIRMAFPTRSQPGSFQNALDREYAALLL